MLIGTTRKYGSSSANSGKRDKRYFFCPISFISFSFRCRGECLTNLHSIAANIFVPILETKQADIQATKKETYQYGPTERHKLDVYYPPKTPTSGHPHILFFSYGGGFYMGSRSLPAPADIIYSNLGAFFSKRGFITVIPRGLGDAFSRCSPRCQRWAVDTLPTKSDIYVLLER